MHSTTKYLGGHSDAVGGAVVVRDPALHEAVRFVQNSVGAVPGPLDCFLVHRGLRTLHLRMAAHTENARVGRGVAARASRASPTCAGPGSPGWSRSGTRTRSRIVAATKVFSLAESLGGVESLIEVPQAMTHQSVEGSGGRGAGRSRAALVRGRGGRGPRRGPRAGDRRAQVAGRRRCELGGFLYVSIDAIVAHPRWMRRIALAGHDGRPRHARRRLTRARRGRPGPAGAGRRGRDAAAGRAAVRGEVSLPPLPTELARQGPWSRSRARAGVRRRRPPPIPGLTADRRQARRARPPRPCAARTRRAAAPTPSTRRSRCGNGVALPPLEAPEAVKQIIEAGNGIARTPYKWGGGHGKWQDTGYDCSGSVSFVLAAAGLLSGPLASGPLMSWGEPGKGKWVTIYANAGHVFLEVAGIRFDTSAERDRLALDQRDALHGGLRGAAPARALTRIGVSPHAGPAGCADADGCSCFAS